MDKTYIELKEQHDILQEENNTLKQQMVEMNKYTTECDIMERLYGKTYSRGGYFGRMRKLPDFDEKWKNTSFWKYHNDLSRYCFHPMDIVGKQLMEFRQQVDNSAKSFSCKVMAYCEMAMCISSGYLLCVYDPFIKKEIILLNIQPPEPIEQYVGKILYLSCIEMKGTKTLQAERIEKLPYNLYSIL